MAKRFLVLGDSLTFGRPSHQIYSEDTWPGLIEAAGHRVFHRGRGSSDSTAVLAEVTHLHAYMIGNINDMGKPFDICLIQVGIVDCTPRLCSRRLCGIFRLFPGGSRMAARLSRVGSLVQLIGSPWVSLVKFEQNVFSIFEVSSQLATKVVFIEIAKPARNLINNCGDFSLVVERYNKVLKKLRNNFLPVYSNIEVAGLFLPDGHHLTKDGHQHIAKRILSHL